MDDRPRIQIEVHFNPTASGGRASTVSLTIGRYRPHLVVGSGEYLGVCFLHASKIEARPGDTVSATVALVYPGVDYSALVPDAVFKVLEGAQVVATGRVLALE
jgi:translation elongation factor EF-Tu-like GTPase